MKSKNVNIYEVFRRAIDVIKLDSQTFLRLDEFQSTLALRLELCAIF